MEEQVQAGLRDRGPLPTGPETVPHQRTTDLRPRLARCSRAVLLGTIFALLGAMLFASASQAAHQHAGRPAEVFPGRCIVHSSPSFVESGEFSSASSFSDVVEVECEPTYAEAHIEIASEELNERCRFGTIWFHPNEAFPEAHYGPSIEATLDDDGNATVAVMGQNCAAGESLITAELLSAPYTTVTTGFTLLPPAPNAEVGVWSNPATEVEDATTSSVATVVDVSFPPVYAEKYVNLDVRELYRRCGGEPHTVWILPGIEGPAVGFGPTFTVRLDNDGNAWVLLLGDSSCAAGSSLVEASLESAPYTTYESSFTVEPPVPTLPEPGFTIEKLQKLPGEATYTKAKVEAKNLSETVEYKIVVRNTGNVPIGLSSLIDTKCEGVHGGATTLAVGAETTFYCEHKWTQYGKWINEALIEGNGERQHSNEVEAVVEKEIPPPKPKFTIEKLQRIGANSEFKTSELIGAVGQTVEYEIVVTNVGTVAVELANFSDEHCEAITGGTATLAPGAHTDYRCTHVLEASPERWTNVATVEGSKEKKESNEVVVRVPPKPEYTIEKLERIGGSGEYGKGPLVGKVGQIVEYEIVVTNTGKGALEFTNLTDIKCEGLVGGPSRLEAGEKATYTCTHKLTEVGEWTNLATIEGNEGTGKKESETVKVAVPAFTIEKLQRLAGETGYVKTPLTGKVGETVEYEIVVKNTGKVPLKFSELVDANCEHLEGGATELAPEASTTFTCSHPLTGPGAWTNVAQITGNEGAGPQSSNEVIVNVPVPPSYTIEKLQRFSGESYTTGELKGTVGQTVEYEILVKNTGGATLSLTEFNDANCEEIKGGASTIAPNETATWTCIHKLAAPGTWMNQASVVGSQGTGPESSNIVIVSAPPAGKVGVHSAPPQCKAPVARYALFNASGPKRKPFSVSISAKGVSKITFYLDGRKLKTLDAAQAKHGLFTITIDPRKLKNKQHKIAVDAVLICGEKIVRGSTFVHPRGGVAPQFTG